MTLLHKNNGISTLSEEKENGNQLFPVFLKLNELHTVLVGAGNVGLEKLNALLQNSPAATVTVIALDILPEVQQCHKIHGSVKIWGVKTPLRQTR